MERSMFLHRSDIRARCDLGLLVAPWAPPAASAALCVGRGFGGDLSKGTLARQNQMHTSSRAARRTRPAEHTRQGLASMLVAGHGRAYRVALHGTSHPALLRQPRAGSPPARQTSRRPTPGTPPGACKPAQPTLVCGSSCRRIGQTPHRGDAEEPPRRASTGLWAERVSSLPLLWPAEPAGALEAAEKTPNGAGWKRCICQAPGGE